jgi:hypothetical protein
MLRPRQAGIQTPCSPNAGLHGITSVVDGSAACNQAQLVGTTDGRTIVPTLAWQKHFDQCARPLAGIMSHQHFRYFCELYVKSECYVTTGDSMPSRFDSKHPGTVFYKLRLADEEKSFQLFPKLDSIPRTRPPAIPPPGLSYQRKQYLYRQN